MVEVSIIFQPIRFVSTITNLGGGGYIILDIFYAKIGGSG